MCGIAGVYSRNDQPVDERILKQMIEAIPYRGPDAQAVWSSGPIGLAHARLSIIDLATGQQPMHSRSQLLTVCFNGEIFNYVELRDELRRKGHNFQTDSDTEVLLHLYEEDGEEMVHRLNGQWAFAIWDARRKRLFLSRDRIGIRPLYYTEHKDCFLFGSEVKALFAHPWISRAIDLVGMDQVLTFWCSVAPRTVFEGIKQLPPGHNMRVTPDGIEVWRYWELDYTAVDPNRSEEDAVEELGSILEDATRIRLRSDVPVGAYLSGGLDSSVITGLVKRLTRAPLRTFSVGFQDAEFDESDFQREVISHLQTDHSEVICSYDSISRVFPEVVWHCENPIVRTAPAPLFLLSKLVREQGFKVVLTGEGADEMLGGYDIFKEAKIRRFWAAQPNSRWRPMLLKRLYPYMQDLQSQSDAYRRAFFHVRAEELGSPFFSHLPRWDLTATLKRFYSPEIKETLGETDPYKELSSHLPRGYAAWDGFSQSQYLESTGLLPGYILSSQGDRMAMGNSVEGRFPFLDVRLMEFAQKLSPKLKMKVLNEKYLLKRFAVGLVPEAVRNRPKQPYRAPDARSFFGAESEKGRFGYVDDLLCEQRIASDGLFHPKAVSQLMRKIRSGRPFGVRDNMALVGILSTQLLVDQFINQFEKRQCLE